VNDAYIPESEFASLIERLRPLAEQDKELTTFEIATALAFTYFAQTGVEVAVVEVGLGGRLDATNVVHPVAAIITTIGHDHVHILGSTLAKIATEKAGIIKEGVPVITAPQEPASMAVLERTCAEKHAPLHAVGRDWKWRATRCSLEGQDFTATGRLDGASRASYRGLHVPLLGKHQLRNAAVVLATIEVLRERGLEIADAHVRDGLRSVVWPARFEVLGDHPYFVVDGAHNVDSARCLAATLRQYFPDQRAWLVLAILNDKDISAILKQLLPQAQGTFFARSHHPRAAEPEQLQEHAAHYNVPTAIIRDIGQATLRALNEAGDAGLVVAAGSFTTAAEAREAWLRQHNQPLPPLDPL